MNIDICSQVRSLIKALRAQSFQQDLLHQQTLSDEMIAQIIHFYVKDVDWQDTGKPIRYTEISRCLDVFVRTPCEDGALSSGIMLGDTYSKGLPLCACTTVSLSLSMCCFVWPPLKEECLGYHVVSGPLFFVVIFGPLGPCSFRCRHIAPTLEEDESRIH